MWIGVLNSIGGTVWGGREKQKEDESKKNQVRTEWEKLSKCTTKYPISIQEGSVTCNPGSWVPPFDFRADFSLVFTGGHSLRWEAVQWAWAGHFLSRVPFKVQSIFALGRGWLEFRQGFQVPREDRGRSQEVWMRKATRSWPVRPPFNDRWD